jgi:glycosyltransferase involved in cell wall biosynthesis
VKVLHLATRFLKGGSEQRIAALIRALPSDLYEHHVIVGADHDPESIHALLNGTSFLVETHLLRAVRPHRDLEAVARLANQMRLSKYDIVHTCQSKAGIVGRAAARLAKTPIVVHSLTMSNFGSGFGGPQSEIYRKSEKLVGRWTDAYFAVGADLRDRYVAAGIASPNRFHIIRSPIDVDRFRCASMEGKNRCRAMLGLKAGVPLVAYIGSIDGRKGVMDLPKLHSHIRRLADVPVQLALAGEGPLRSPLERSFHEAGLGDDVHFLGHIDHVPVLMGAADCVVLLSRAEGLPQVLVQAAATGRPFVCYAVDGPTELIDRGAVGTVVRQDDDLAAAKAVVHYLRCSSPAPQIDLDEWRRDVVLGRFRKSIESLLHGLSLRPAEASA